MVKDLLGIILLPQEFVDVEKVLVFKNPMILAESALLYESGMDKYLDKVIFVDVSYEVRLDRTIKRDKITQVEYDNRMRNQISPIEKIKMSNFVIDNSLMDSKEYLVKNIYNILVG